MTVPLATVFANAAAILLRNGTSATELQRLLALAVDKIAAEREANR